MASFMAMQPLRLAVAQARAVPVRAFSAAAPALNAGSPSQRAPARDKPAAGAKAGSSDSRSDLNAERNTSSRGPRDRGNALDGKSQWSGPRRPREWKDQGKDRRVKQSTSTSEVPSGLAQLLDTLATLKAEGRTPAAAAYVAVIAAAADYHARRGVGTGDQLGYQIALAAARDAEAGDITLGPEAIDEFLKFAYVMPEILPSLLVELTGKYKPTKLAYSVLAHQAVAGQHLESLILIVLEMMSQDIWPDKHIVKNLILLCAEWGHPRLALDFIEKITASHKGKISSDSWVHVLSASADAQYLEGVKVAWHNVISNKAYSPDEGLILAVLAVAGRWGDVQLAIEALSLLPGLGVQVQEHHLAPLLEAYCRDKKVPEAFKVVTSMRNAGVNVTLTTVKPIVHVLKSAEVLDQAFYTLEDQHKAGEAVDVAVFNALIEAAANQGDLQRARATQTAAADLGVTPDRDTFHAALRACIKAKHRELGDNIFEEMEKAGFKPDEESYALLIGVCLTQSTYEDAFYYLEKMKSDGFRPSQEVYNNIGRKCAANSDGRWRLVADEMTALGYSKINFEEQNERMKKARSNQSGGKRFDGNASKDHAGQKQRRDRPRRVPAREQSGQVQQTQSAQ